MTAKWRPTRVQQDVIDRLRDGAVIEVRGTAMLRVTGEPDRHVRATTFEALVNRGVIVNGGFLRHVWTLAAAHD